MSSSLKRLPRKLPAQPAGRDKSSRLRALMLFPSTAKTDPLTEQKNLPPNMTTRHGAFHQKKTATSSSKTQRNIFLNLADIVL